MFYIWAWLVLYTFVSIVLPHSISFSLLTLLTLTTLLLWVFLCGGPSAMYEVLEARTQPRIPLVPPHPARRPVVVVIGSATGLGQQVAALCRRKKYIVQEGDVQFSGAKHCDLTSIPSIQKFVATIITTIDVLVLSAGICDATGVPISGQQSIHPRMLWVNFLGQVCFLEEAKKQGIAIQKIVSITSGAYARGTTKEYYSKTWNVLAAMKYYSQSKFLLTTYFARLQMLYGTNVTMVNPGPMRSTMGDQHVPLLLWPMYGLMKEVLFPLPKEAAKTVMYCIDAKKNIKYMHIRIEAALSPIVKDLQVQEWVMKHTRAALQRWYHLD